MFDLNCCWVGASSSSVFREFAETACAAVGNSDLETDLQPGDNPDRIPRHVITTLSLQLRLRTSERRPKGSADAPEILNIPF